MVTCGLQLMSRVDNALLVPLGYNTNSSQENAARFSTGRLSVRLGTQP